MIEQKKTFVTASILREAGIASIPVKADKRPLVEWRKYVSELPTEAEIARWYTKDAGIALIAGKVQCLDFDEKYSAGIFSRFVKRAPEVGLDYLLAELIRQKTPSGGYHLVWRCDERQTEGNRKLAEKPNHECMIETRGNGGYFLIAPSDNYTLEQGDWSSIPVISGEDHDALLELAQSFDERPAIEPEEPAPTQSTGATPGDDYDFRADIPALLKSHCWKPTNSSQKYWTRPGKTSGISATWDVVPGRFFVFSSSTQFEPQHVYKPWHVYAMLECGGDFARAAAELRRQGFGTAPKKVRQQYHAGDIDPVGVEPMPDDPPGVEGCDPFGEAPTNETEEDKIRRMLRARAFDDANEPPELVPLFTLAGIVICTPGNLAAVTAPAKVGKSAFMSAMMAATMTPPEADADCLSIVGYNQDGKAVRYFDTEQSPYHFWHLVNRGKRRAKVPVKPDWLGAYCIADMTADQIRKAIAIEMADAAEVYGGIHSIVIDGVADLVADVNDATECNALVAELHTLAIRYNCSIICVIHKNPGTDKMRGHLGSQIQRKAETNLSLDKQDGVTVVWSTTQRGAPIEKKDAPRFAWDDDLKMHVSVGADASKPDTKLKDLLGLAEEVLKPGELVKWSELVGRLITARTTPGGRPPADKTAQRWVSEMKTKEILSVSFGAYQLNPKHQL